MKKGANLGRTSAALALVFGALAAGACGDEDRPPVGALGVSGSSGRGGSTGSAGSEQSGAGQGGEPSPSGGQVGADGGAAGSVICSDVEQCSNGADDDCDGADDCLDGDCESACADPCAEPAELSDPAELTASTSGRIDVLSSGCSASSGDSGPDVVYAFTAAQTGTLEIELAATRFMVFSLHQTCAGSSTALACDNDFLSLPIEEGDELFIAVESPTPDDAGEFTLRAHSRANDVCGDGYRDPGESCDDGGLFPNDGCDASCAVESLETESNDAAESADEYYDGFYAEIAPAGDVDVVAVDLAGEPGSLIVQVRGLGNDCERLRSDSYVEVLDPDGTTVIDQDDDGGDELCSRLVVSGLAEGTHYVRVSASPEGDTATFPYLLDITRNWCGDGLLGPGETCDEGDAVPGDGCSETCQEE